MSRNNGKSEVVKPIFLDDESKADLINLIRMQTELDERVKLAVKLLRQALKVPAGWVLQDVNEGFRPPATEEMEIIENEDFPA